MKLYNLGFLIAFASSAMASPTIEARSSANINLYSDDTCQTAPEVINLGTGAERCIKVTSGKRSIRVTEFGCPTYTWSGTDCRGSSRKINTKDTCVSVLYGSVSVNCN